MRDYVHEHFSAYDAKNDGEYSRVRGAIICKDGAAFSVQASDSHYSTPKEDRAPYYTAVELWVFRKDGRPLTREPEGWVPVEKVNARIHRHGGPA